MEKPFEWECFLHGLVKILLFPYTVHRLTAFSVYSYAEANHKAMFGRMQDEGKNVGKFRNSRSCNDGMH